jgi:hypothetical protein
VRYSSSQQILRKRNQSRKFVIRVNVFFNDVKCKIVKPAKTPNCQREQNGSLPFWVIEKNQNGGNNSDKQKQNAFQFNPKRI